jgi:hypothetical protein
MRLDSRQRWILLGGLLAATLAAAAWVGERSAPDSELVAASEPDAKAASSQSPRAEAASKPAQLNLEKLQSRDLGGVTRDPFSAPRPRVAKPAPAPLPAPPVQVVAAPPPPPPPSAPPLPFTYMGKLVEGDNVAVFLSQGERNLVVRQGQTIDSIYRVERIAESAITLTYLPLDQRQTIVIGDPK